MIEITIGKDGKVKVEASGYAGLACQTATAPFIDALGLRNAPETLKDEAFQVEEVELHQGGGQ